MQAGEHSLTPLSSPPHAARLTTTHSCQQDAYELGLVAQYLDLNQESTASNKTVSNKDSSSEAISLFSNGGESQKKRISAFHNFQKHIIITLKRNIKIKKTCAVEGSKLSLACDLWEYVIASTKTSKKWFLGVLGNNLQHNREIINDPRWSDLGERVIEAGEAQTRSAQAYVRGAIVRQARGMLDGRLLQGRRIQRLEEFTLYFKEFIKEIQQGVATRRLPKLKRQKMERERGQCNHT